MSQDAPSVARRRQIAAWAAVSISSAISSLWAFWGIIENFHEGWSSASLWSNLGMMLVQYLSPMLLFMLVASISVSRPRIGAGMHAAMALGVMWFFGGSSNPGSLLITLPLVLLSALYWFGRAAPRRLAIGLAIVAPLLTAALAGAGPAWRVSQRRDDGDRGARLVRGNGVELIWAGEGPGWPSAGTDWNAAMRACDHLAEDGMSLDPVARGLWRLPSVEETVRSMTRHGANAVGEWDTTTGRAEYAVTPDKESPLWDVHSQVIYWWTATQADATRAYIIAYDGQVWPRDTAFASGSLGYRCVRG